MAVTVAVLARHVGALLGDAEEQAYLTELAEVAAAMVEVHAPLAPVGVQNRAILQVAGLLWSHRGVSGDTGRVRRVAPLADSGAASILSPYRQPQSRTAGGTE